MAPLMVMLPGKVHQEHWYTKTGLENNVLVAVLESGYTYDHLALKWLAHFNKLTKPANPGAYPMLLLNGHIFHQTKLFLGYCELHKIVPFFVMPHMMHLLQPLEFVLYQSYKHSQAEDIDEATRTGCTNFKKTEFLASLSSIRQHMFKHSLIVSSVRKTDIIPFN